MSPSVGFISTENVIPTPTTETSTGKNTTLRRYPRPMICEVSSTPSSIPRTTFAPEVSTA